MSTKEELAIPKSGNEFIQKLEKLVLWQRVAILVGLIVLVVGAAVWFLFLPQYEEISQLDGKLQGLEKKLVTAKLNAAELGKFQAKIQEADAQFKFAMRALPEKEEIPSLLTSISAAGQEVGLTLSSFNPVNEILHEFYADIPVHMTIRGDFQNTVIFFDTVARLSRIVNIKEIKMTPTQEGRLINTTCVAVTYKFVEPPPEKAAAGAKPTSSSPAKPGAGQQKKNSKMNF